MAKFYYKEYDFPHTSFELNDFSTLITPAAPLDNTCRALTGIVADMGPDDRTMVVTTVSGFTELFGTQTSKRHGLMGKAAIRHLTAGGHVYVRRLTDDKAKNSNASLDVTFTTPDTPSVKYFVLKDNTWTSELPTGVDGTDFVTVTFTNTPVVTYGTNSHVGLKTKTDAELVTVTQVADTSTTVPAYVLMRTGAGSSGNKTQVTFNRVTGYSDNRDSVYEMNIIISQDQNERYKVNAVQDSRASLIPLNISQAVNAASDQLAVYSSEANDVKLMELTLEAVEKLELDLTTAVEALASNTLAQAALQLELDKATELKEALEQEDIEVTAVTSILGYNDRFPIFSDLIENQDTYVSTVKLANGTNGELLKGKFDWNYTVTDATLGDIRIYEKLFTEFFEGFIDETVYDFNETPVDVIHDIGYPLIIKEMISKFCSIPYRRDVVATIAAPKTSSLAELKSFDEGFKLDNYNCMKVVNWADYYDDAEKKTLNVPVSYLMITAIVQFFNDGWNDPILAGRVVSGPIAGTVTPAISILTDETDKTYLVHNGWNYISNSSLGYIIDGQKMASTNPYEISILQEFHNEVLIGRIMKKITDALNRNRHFLQKPDKVPSVIAAVNEELEEFRSKCSSAIYNAYYKDAFDDAQGLLTNELDLTLYGSNKSHKFIINTYRHSSVTS